MVLDRCNITDPKLIVDYEPGYFECTTDTGRSFEIFACSIHRAKYLVNDMYPWYTFTDVKRIRDA